jgi:hypothetical protein
MDNGNQNGSGCTAAAAAAKNGGSLLDVIKGFAK